MSKMIEVRIRHIEELKARHLTTWPMDDLGGVLRTLAEWGIESPSGSFTEATFGQIVAGEEVFFEVVFGTDDE